jgi:diacylglycerol kinase (ATP)
LDITTGSAERTETFPQAWFVAVTNTPTYGGGLKIAPQADISDRWLEVCIAKQTSRRKLLRNFPRIFSGKHLSLPFVESFQAREIQISAGRRSVVFADGELLGYPPVIIQVASAKAKFFSL